MAWENPVETWHLILLFALAVLGFIWEIRKQKPRKVMRIIALLVAVISLYIIYLSPFTFTEKPNQSVVLFGEDIDVNIIDSIRVNYDLPAFQQQSEAQYLPIGQQQATSLQALDFQIDTVFVYGYIPQLNPKHYQVRKDIMQQNGIRLDYPKSIALGDSLKIAINNRSDKSLKVSAVLGQDSISKLIPKADYTYISTLPKASGYHLCQIYTDDESYQFVVYVEKAETYVVQILAETPDFEWKFFTEYLKSKGHSIFQRTKISSDKYKSSFYNWDDSLTISRGGSRDLKVLFADAVAWQNLTENTRSLFLEKLKENRGSLIFRTNPNSQISLSLDKAKPTKIFSTGDNLLEGKQCKSLQFNNIGILHEVAKNRIFRRITPAVIFGIINFQNSYQLILAGKKAQYEQIWSPVFEQLVRKSNRVFIDQSQWAVQNQPYYFRLWQADSLKEISMISPQSDTLKLESKADFLYPERKHFMFYPDSIGWHFIKLKSQVELIPFYVHSEYRANQLEFLSNYNNDYLNYRNFDGSMIQQKKYNEKSVTLWFFMLFVLSVGYLWIEDKIT